MENWLNSELPPVPWSTGVSGAIVREPSREATQSSVPRKRKTARQERQEPPADSDDAGQPKHDLDSFA